MKGSAGTTTGRGVLPAWRSVLAVVAHPDDESFGLGAVLGAFSHAGAAVTVLCFTRGEASTLDGEVVGDLATVRAEELATAARELGVGTTVLGHHPDGALSTIAPSILIAEVAETIRRYGAEGLVVFDTSGIAGHPDHIAATDAALGAADATGLPVLAWTLPQRAAEQLNAELDAGFIGHEDGEIDIVLPVDRARQHRASLAHVSQAIPTSVLWRRLELLGDHEHLRWLRRP